VSARMLLPAPLAACGRRTAPLTCDRARLRFGSKVIMLPAYTCCILTKLGLAVGLLVSLAFEPVGGYKEQLEWLWCWWCAHNTYAWVRLWMVFFTTINAVREDQYTVAVMLAGAICCGQAVGFLFLVFFFTMVFFHQLLLLRESGRLHDDIADGLDPDVAKLEARHYSLFWQEATRDWVTTQPEVLARAMSSLKRRGLIEPVGVVRRPLRPSWRWF
jgi:hypothetical protein